MLRVPEHNVPVIYKMERKDTRKMKKKLITVLMTAMMIISLAACGGEGAGEDVPATGSAVQDGVPGTEETEGSSETGSEAKDQEEESQPEESSQTEPSEETPEEPDEPEDLYAGLDAEFKQWAMSIDWEYVVYLDSSDIKITRYEIVDNSISEIKYNGASSIEEAVNTILEMDPWYEEKPVTYAKDVDDETKDILERYMAMDETERDYLQDCMWGRIDEDGNRIVQESSDGSTATIDPESISDEVVQWTESIDWEHKVGTYERNGQELDLTIKAFIMSPISAWMKERTVEEEINFSLGPDAYNTSLAYEDLDDYTKDVIEKLSTLNFDEAGYVYDYAYGE